MTQPSELALVIAQQTTALAMILQLLVHHLDEGGSISKDDFRKRLLAVADDVEANTPPELKGRPRLDLLVARQFAEGLQSPQPAWTPVVVQGGKQDDDEV